MIYKKINTAGQVTAIVTEKTKLGNLPIIAKSIMASDPTIEQVGYLQNDKFMMMGGELSINGLLAAAFLLNKSGRVNGLKFKINGNIVSIIFPDTLVIKINPKINNVRLEGINYKIIAGFPPNQDLTVETRRILQDLALDYPASGIIYVEKNRIQPIIFVKATNSYIWENACGSGSLAASLITGNQKIIQPSGQIISFETLDNNIVVTTTAKEV